MSLRVLIRLAFLLALSVLLPAPSKAQQVSDSARAVVADTSRASSPRTPLLGPRRSDDWQPLRPTLRPADPEPAASAGGSMLTLRLSTLDLVLIGVIVLLLIVR